MRYMLNFAYIGTHFRGAQKQVTTIIQEDRLSVQGNIEIALKRFNNFTLPAIALSSRTDSGVHALNTTAHVDLYKNNGPFNCDKITSSLNKFFSYYNIDITIHGTRLVPDTFHARFSALSRTYLYRLAVLRPNYFAENPFSVSLPIEESNRCYVIRNESFEIEKLKKAALLFEGTHDFESFKKAHKCDEWENYTRTIYTVEVNQDQPIKTSQLHNYGYDQLENFTFYTVKFKGRGFVHNQIRRMVGALIAVATGKIQELDIRTMLQVPSRHSWDPKAKVAPACGLYLCDVEYNLGDLLIPEDKKI